MNPEYVAPMAGLPLQQVERHKDNIEFAMVFYFSDDSLHLHVCEGPPDLIEYMHDVSGVPRFLCATFVYLDRVQLNTVIGGRTREINRQYEIALAIVEAEGEPA